MSYVRSQVLILEGESKEREIQILETTLKELRESNGFYESEINALRERRRVEENTEQFKHTERMKQLENDYDNLRQNRNSQIVSWRKRLAEKLMEISCSNTDKNKNLPGLEKAMRERVIKHILDETQKFDTDMKITANNENAEIGDLSMIFNKVTFFLQDNGNSKLQWKPLIRIGLSSLMLVVGCATVKLLLIDLRKFLILMNELLSDNLE